MKVKVGQWVRYNSHKINGGIIQFCEWHREDEMEITTVSDTPQELIQVGDLVYDKENEIAFVVDFIEYDKNNIPRFGIISNNFKHLVKLNNIGCIYTPDSNGNYIKQWEEIK